MQRGLTLSVFGVVILCLVGVGLFGTFSEKDHQPDFILLDEGILWLKSNEENVYVDMQRAVKHLEDRNLKPRRIYLEHSEVALLVSTLNLNPKLKHMVLSEPGIFFDCRQPVP